MAGKSAGPSPFGNWAAIIAVIALGTYFFNTVNLPFQGSRPAASSGTQRSLAETQDVDARLWQDPLGAVRKDVENQEKTGHKSGCHTGPACLELGPDDMPAILAVLVPGSSYSEAEELRRQIRYGVLSSLGTQKYDPLDSEHIGYFPFSLSDAPQLGAKCAATVKAPTNIAYEQFGLPPGATGTGKFFVLWINEDDFVTVTKNCPLSGLSALQAALQNIAPRTTIKFLGPASSSTLKSMIEEASDSVRCTPIPGLKETRKPRGLTLYNFLATAEETALAVPSCRGESIAAFFQAADITYYRTIADDFALATALVGELKLRGVSFDCDSQDRILLVSEWDTFYGRTFPESIKRASKASCANQNGFEKFRAVRYMRGLDGKVSDSASRGANPNAGDGDDAGSARQPPGMEEILRLYAASPTIERPEGNAQYDYLRRLGTGLGDELRAANNGTIRAIGVVGSDVYDKLAVLQQLHAQFPGATFFTTDLDARLFHPSQAEWARNLIVASSYDLELHSSIQSGIPPFRSSYQTAAFLTTRLALEDTANAGLALQEKTKAKCQAGSDCCLQAEYRQSPFYRKDPLCKRDLAWASQPKLFQIPYRRLFAQPLQTDSPDSNDSVATSLRERTSISRQISVLFPGASGRSWESLAIGSLLLGALFFVTGLLFSHHFRDACKMQLRGSHTLATWGVLIFVLIVAPLIFVFLNQPSMPLAVSQPFVWFGATSAAGMLALHGYTPITRTARTALMAALCVAGGALYYVYWPDIGAVLTQSGNGEPLLLLSGISLWPSLALRLVGIILCIKFTGDVIRHLDRNMNHLASDFCLPAPLRAAEGIVDAVTDTWRAVIYVIKTKPQEIGHYVVKVFVCPLRRKLTEPAPGDDPTCRIEDVWDAYRTYGSTPVRICRTVAIVAACVLLQVLLYPVLDPVLGSPHAVGRGALVQYSAWIISWTGTVVLWFLVIYVTDATLICWRFLMEMRRFRSIWPDAALALYHKKLNIKGKPVAELMDVEFVGKRTACITKLILYPFIVLTLLIVSQSPLLDDMPPDWPRLITMGAAFAVILLCAVGLPIAAERLRDVAIGRLSDQVFVLRTTGGADQDAGQIDLLIKKIEDYRVGAFTPVTQQPVAHALLLPLSGLGGTTLLQYFALPGV